MKFISVKSFSFVLMGLLSVFAWDDINSARNMDEETVFRCSQKCQYLLTIPPRYEQWEPKECSKHQHECICSGGTENGLLLCMSECVGIDCEEFVDILLASDKQLEENPIEDRFEL